MKTEKSVIKFDSLSLITLIFNSVSSFTSYSLRAFSLINYSYSLLFTFRECEDVMRFKDNNSYLLYAVNTISHLYI